MSSAQLVCIIICYLPFGIFSLSSLYYYKHLFQRIILIQFILWFTRVLPCSLYYHDTTTSTQSVFEINQEKKLVIFQCIFKKIYIFFNPACIQLMFVYYGHCLWMSLLVFNYILAHLVCMNHLGRHFFSQLDLD